MGLFPEWTWIVGLMIGAAIGSFLNVVIYRMPRGIPLHNPASSFCPKCKHPLGVADLVPLFSWLSTRGRCRHCSEPVAARYFIVEVVTGVIWAVLWQRFLVDTDDVVTACFYMAASAVLVAIIFIDWELYIIPDELNAVLLLIGIGYGASIGKLESSLWGAFAGWGLLWGIALLGRLAFGKDAMGHGDIKMMRGVGALLGPTLLLANVGIAVVMGLVVGVSLMLAFRKKEAPSGSQEAESEKTGSGPSFEPEPVRDLFVLGAYYLLCLDVLATVFRGIESTVAKMLIQKPQLESIEDDTWQPSITTIPFGPYLAAGAIVCMVAGAQIDQAMADYWRNATGEATSRVKPSGRT